MDVGFEVEARIGGLARPMPDGSMSIGWKYTALTVSGPHSWSECFSSTWISSKPAESLESSLLESSAFEADAEALDLSGSGGIVGIAACGQGEGHGAGQQDAEQSGDLLVLHFSFLCCWMWKKYR